MRQRPFLVLLACFAVVLLLGCGGTGSSTPNNPPPVPPPEPPKVDAQVVSWLQGQVRPLATIDAGAPDGDLVPFDEAVGSAHLVGLGEATHGTHEFLKMKHRLLQYLVEKKGFRAFVTEAGMANCLAIQDYIMNGVGDARAAVAGQLSFNCANEEVLSMVQWMRAWNQAHSDPTDKVWYMGMDMTDPRHCFPMILAYVQPLDATLSSQLDGWFSEFRTRTITLDMEGYARLPEADRARIHGQLQQAYDALESRRTEFIASSSAPAFEQTLRLAKTLLQAEAAYAASTTNLFVVRDAAMAENIQWIMAQRGLGTRAVVSAHDYHVSRTPTCMGAVLTQAMGSDYRVLGFSFYQGELSAVGPTGLGVWQAPPLTMESYDGGFHLTGVRLFFLNLTTGGTGPGPTWLQGPHWKREIGAAWTPNLPNADVALFPLTQAFDMLIHVDTSTASKTFK